MAPIAAVILTLFLAAVWVGLVRGNRVQPPEPEFRLELKLPSAAGAAFR